jgi:hypothetical protein
VIERRLIARALAPRAGVPLGHLARFGSVEPEAEAEAGLSLFGEHAGDQRLLAAREAHRVHVDKS